MLTRRDLVRCSLLGTLYSQLGVAADSDIAGKVSEQITGQWFGVLNLGSRQLRLKINITDGSKVTLYSVDQGNTPIDGEFKFSANEKLRMEWSSIHARYVGRRLRNDQIEGIWQQGGDIPLTLTRGNVTTVSEQLPEPLTPLILESLRAEAGAPALTAAANVRNGTELLWATGKREINGPAHVTTNDLWHLGSITKSMTATLIARLVDAKSLTWNEQVGTVLKEIAPNMHEQYKSVTLKHLLSHRSGMPANIAGLGLASYAAMGNANVVGQRRRYTRDALAMTPLGAKEATYGYSNNGYVVAATLVETLLGKPWEELISTHVFTPLGLLSAGFGAPNAGIFGKLKQPIGHMTDLGSRIASAFGANAIRGVHAGFSYQTDNPAVLGPAGRVHMSLTDMLKYLAAHADHTPFLTHDSWQVLHTPPFGGDYAMGWTVRKDGSLWHNGSNTMWYAEVMFNRTTGISAVAACNEARVPATIAVGKALLSAARAAELSPTG